MIREPLGCYDAERLPDHGQPGDGAYPGYVVDGAELSVWEESEL